MGGARDLVHRVRRVGIRTLVVEVGMPHLLAAAGNLQLRMSGSGEVILRLQQLQIQQRRRQVVVMRSLISEL